MNYFLYVYMGRYFGLINNTRKHKVSSYWKGSPPDVEEVREIALDLKWDLDNDEIFSYSYCDAYKWAKNDWHELDSVKCVSDPQKKEKDDVNWTCYGVVETIKCEESAFDPTFFCN